MLKRRKQLLALLGAASLTLTSVAPANLVYAEEPQGIEAEAVEQQEAEAEQDVETVEEQAAEEEAEKAETKEVVKYNSDFSGGENSNWEITAGPNGDIAGEVTYADNTMTLNGFQGIAFDPDAPEIADGTIQTRVKASQLNSLMIVFRYQDKNNFASLGFGTNTVGLVTRTNGGEYYSFPGFSYDYGNKEYVDIKCTFKGNDLQLFIDGKKAASFNYEGTFKGAGKMGIRHWGSPLDTVSFESMSCTNEIIDTKGIYALIEKAKTYDKSMYTEESFAALEEAIANAQEAADAAESQATINAAAEALQTAINGLEYLEAVKPEPVVLENDTMKVTLNKKFPYIMQYEMNGKTLLGNPDIQNTIVINGTDYVPEVVCEEKDGKLVYNLAISSIGVSMDVTYALDKNNVKMNVANIKETGDVKVESLEFKNDVIATTGTDMQTSSLGLNVYDRRANGGYPAMLDRIWETMDKAVPGKMYQTYATLASNGLALTVNNTTVNTETRLTSNVYEENGIKIGQIGNGKFDYSLPGTEKKYEPSAVITLCEDYNEDGDINYQDAAANYKNIRSEVFGGDKMKDNLLWIAYNSVSQAQEPFMRTLDVGKEVYNFTDGFGQMILEKGYEAQGHDTMHGLYGYNVGEQQGGADDFKKVMEIGKKYDMKFGVHLNVNEHHVESMNYDTVRHPLSPGWGLWSQAYWVNQYEDVVSGNREKRLRMLGEELPDLKFIYYDIYGNDGAPVWQGQSLAEVTNDMGMILATEFNGPLEQQAAFTHWGNDLDYPNTGNESRLMRYFKNDMDIFIGNALLKGNKMLNIGTWEESNTDMIRGVQSFYNHTLPTKYLQHFDLMDYEKDYARFTDGVMTERKGDTVELTKDGKLMASWKWWNNSESGKERQEITGDTTLLLPWYDKDSTEKDPSEADKLYYWNPEGTETTWDVSIHEGWGDGTTADVYRLTTDEKEKVGTVTVKNGQITLNQEAGYGYALYPTGKAPEKAVVNFGEGTPLKDPNFINDKGDAWKLTGDVSYKKDEAVINDKTDTKGYDLYNDDSGYDPYLSFEGEGTASQKMTGLKPGKTYTVYGFADVAEEGNLEMSVTVDGKEYKNSYEYTELKYRGIPRYANTHTQKVRVVFDVPEGVIEADLTFKGNGNVRLQDLRVWENLNRTPQITDEGMEDYILYEDFENVEQGYGPFIVDQRHGTWDIPVQVAEYRESRPEYDNKETGEKWKQFSDYVANGRYSLKTDVSGNGFDRGGTSNGPVYRSIEGAVKFEPNTTYEINFKYVTGVSDRHDIEVRDKAGRVIYKYNFKATERVGHSLETAEETATFTTGNRDDYYVVVNLIDNKAGLEPYVDENGSIMERCFLSLDDISIKKVSATEEVSREALEELINKAKTGYTKEDYDSKVWEDFQKEIVEAQVTLDKDNSTQADIEKAYRELSGAIVDLESSKGISIVDDSKDISMEGVIVTAGDEEKKGTFGKDGLAELAIDGDESTSWFTSYDGWATTIVNGKGWIDLQYPEPQNVNGVRYLAAQDNHGYSAEPTLQYEVWVKTVGSDEYQLATSGEWANDSNWKKTSFETIDNVTNVRLLSKKTPHNWWATAAEVRVTYSGENVVDKTALQTAVDVAAKLNKDAYTESTWAVLETKLAAAQAVLANEEATEYDVLLAVTNLETALDALVEAADKEDLAALIEYAESQKENENYQYVVPVVKEKFEAALAEAVAVNENGDATQAEVDAAYDKLLNMIRYLDFTGNSESLKVLVDTAKGLNEKLYTPETWEVLTEALAKAEAVLADENALQKEIDAAAEELQAAMDSLVKNPVDKSKLQKLVDKSKKYEDKISEYTPATAEIFQGALDYAREILANEDATQEEVDAAYAALQNAIFQLRLIPNKDKLGDLIKNAEKVDTAKYTEESVAVFTGALLRAKAVFADANATAEDVKAAEKDLKKAQKNLVAKADADDDKDNNGNGNNGNNSGKDNNGKDNNGKDNNGNVKDNGKNAVKENGQPKTGDPASTLPLVGTAVASGLAAVFAFLRKRK